ncbi:GntR family transcriptional regulator [Pseudorhodoferax sp.]|uniref:GntR family transcriptional regulator n=1 Tax=Pseudorhodoferax sp. TaxID=1993553 RepID=UPI0039E5D2BF
MDGLSLHIDPGAPDPIYRQIVGQVTRLVAARQWPPGTQLPSVREVAAAHAVNPMTVSKAYALLQEQGVLERRRGVGMVVAAQARAARSAGARLQALEPALRALARQARELGLDAEQVAAALRSVMEGGEA